MTLTILPIIVTPKFADTTVTVSSANLNLVIKAPSSAVFVQATIAGEQSAVFQSTQLLFNSPYISSIDNHYFSLDVALGSQVNTITVNYFSTYPSDTFSNLLAAKSPDTTAKVYLDQVSTILSPPLPPTGFDIAERSVEIRLTWDRYTDFNYIGSNVYLSTTSGGPYFKVNTALVTDLDQAAATDRILFKMPISAIPYQYVGTSLDSANAFYAVATNVLQTHRGDVLESPFSMEFEVKFFNYPSTYSSPINRSEKDIQLSLINSINSYDLLQDLKPGSVLQDVFINPVSTELSKIYQRMQFYHYAGFIPTLVKYEDENGDGFADTLAQSPLRQTLMGSFNLSTSEDVQGWIDSAFDRLATKFYDVRGGSTTASGRVTFYTKVKPTQTLTVPVGTVISSDTSLLTGASTVSFITTQTGVIPLDSVGSHYNYNLSRWELPVFVQAQTSGAAGNASAGTITSTSGLPGGLQVVNEQNLFGGKDIESNLDLAARLRNSFIAKDPGRKAGIQAWMSKVPGIYSCKVVAASDPYMMRDYDVTRKLHVYGRADAYVDSRATSEQTQTLVVAPVTLSSSDAGTLVTVSNVTSTDWSFVIQDTRLTAETPIYQVLQVINLNKNLTYNTASWRTSNSTKGSVVLHLDPSQQLGLISPAPDLSDLIQVTVKLLYNTGFQFNKQPVLSVNSIEGEDPSMGGAGIIDTSSIVVIEAQDPLGLGNSTKDTSRLYITPTLTSNLEPFTFEVGNTVYISKQSGVIPLSVGRPTMTNTMDSTALLLEGTHYSLAISDDQRLQITNLNLSSMGAYSLTYKTYQVFPRKISVVAEPIVLRGSVPSYLMNLGIDTNSTSFSLHRDYLGTQLLSRGTDYKLTPTDDASLTTITGVVGNPYTDDYWAASPALISSLSSTNSSTLTIPIGVINKSFSVIPDGTTVYASYDYYENLSCRYSVDQGVIDAQAYAETQKNCTMNLLVKRCNYVPVTIEMSVVLSTGANQSTVESSIRSEISKLFNKLSVGEGITEASIIRAVTSVSGVKNLQIPLNRMSFADGAHINQEALTPWTASTDLGIPATAGVYQCQTQSSYKSIDGGGHWWQYVAVYEDGVSLNRVLDMNEFLYGSAGTSGTFILVGDPSSNKLNVYVKPLLSSTRNADINSHVHTITYHVYGDNSTHDIVGMDLSLLTMGSLSLKFMEG